MANRESARAPLSPYTEVLRNLGLRHERAHLESFSTVTDLSPFDLQERERKALEAIAKRDSVIYQGVLRAQMTVGQTTVEVIGQPDFLIRDGSTYKIRDSKMSRRINERDHPEILLQMGFMDGCIKRHWASYPPYSRCTTAWEKSWRSVLSARRRSEQSKRYVC